jgi:hypothetical protein
MKSRVSRLSPSLLVSVVALFAALGGTGYAATTVTANNLGGQPPSFFLQYRHFAYSHGERFFSAGQTVVLGQNGHFTFSATCSQYNTGQNQVIFDVTANTTAKLNGNGPSPAGTKVNIHTTSDAPDTTTYQVGSAGSSTEIAADGQEADVFYNTGVNWPAGNGSPAHDCFAGYTGLIAGLPSIPGIPG